MAACLTIGEVARKAGVFADDAPGCPATRVARWGGARPRERGTWSLDILDGYGLMCGCGNETRFVAEIECVITSVHNCNDVDAQP